MSNTHIQRPAFYSLRVGSWRDYVTLLHPPYTVWHLSYVIIGAAAAPTMRLDRVGGVTLAFLLAVGLAAHALDELQGRPLKTRIPKAVLVGLSVISLLGAFSIGVVAVIVINLWTILFVFFGTFIVLAYNLEWMKGWFHSDLWFALSWGAFPALTGYWANAEQLTMQAVIVATACMVLSLAQRTLSTRVRELRRRAVLAYGRVEFEDGHVETISVPHLLVMPELVLQMMGTSMMLLAIGLLMARI